MTMPSVPADDDRALAGTPSRGTAWRLERLERARAAEGAGEAATVEQLVGEVLDAYPTSIAGWRLAAAAALLRQDWEQAAARSERLLELIAARGGTPKPGDLRAGRRALLYLASEQRRTGMLDAAERSVVAALALDDAVAWGWREAARIALAGGAPDVAAARLERSLAVADEADRGRRGPRLRQLAGLLRGELGGRSEVGSQPLVVVERGTDALLVTWQLTQLRPAGVLAARHVDPFVDQPDGLATVADHVTIGGQDDAGLARLAAQDAEVAFDHALRASHPAMALHPTEIVEALRYDYWSMVHGMLRAAAALEAELDPTRYSSVVVVRGDGRLWNVLAATARARFGRVLEVAGTIDDPAAASSVRVTSAPSTVPVATRRPAPVAVDRAPASTAVPGAPCIVTCGEPHHALTLIPVARRLAVTGPVNVLALRGPVPTEASLAPYEQLAREEEGIAIDRCLLVDVDEQASDPAVRAPVALPLGLLDGAPLGRLDGRRAILEAELGGALGRVAELRRLAERFEALVARARPAILVLGRDRLSDYRVLLRLARAHGIPSVTLQPGLMSGNAMFNPLQADYATVFDTYTRDLYLERFGARPEQLALTGLPSFDVTGWRRAVREPQAAPVVLLAMQRYSAAAAERLLVAVARAVSRGPRGTRLVVKVHPSAQAGTARRYAEVLEAVADTSSFEVVADGPILEAVEQADLVVSVWSTTLTEAALVGRVALSVRLDGEPLPVPLDELGVAVSVGSEQELLDVLPRLLVDGPDRDEALRRQAAYLERNRHLVEEPSAAERIAEVVRRIAAGTPLPR